MDMSDTQLFAKSCSEATYFPQNIVRQFVSQHRLKALSRRLDEHEERIFCRDRDAAVDMWEYSDSSKGKLQQQSYDYPRVPRLIRVEFQDTCVTGIADLQSQLQGERLYNRDDPRSRFVYVFPSLYSTCPDKLSG